MQRKIPKNIRQIGYANDNDKVYMEDYVDTYLNQLCDKAKEHAEGAFLIGEQASEDGKKHTYIYGAVRMRGLEIPDGKPDISEAVYQMAQEECAKYFDNGSILGWFLAADGYMSGVDANLLRQHVRYLDKPDTFLLLREPDSRDENFYVYRDHELQRLCGHYIYYEKNPSMQNYMIDQRKGVGIESQNTTVDEAAQNFRQILQQKEKKRPDTGSIHRMSYALSTALVLIVLAMGIGALNNYHGLSGLRGVIGVSSGNVNPKPSGDEELSTARGVDEQETASKEETGQNAEAGGDSVQNAGTGAAEGQGANAASSEGQNPNAASSEGQDPNAASSEGQDPNSASSGSVDPNAASSGSVDPNSASSGDQGMAEDQSSDASDAGGQGQSAGAENSNPEKTKTANYYTVRRGDTLASISRKMYGTVSKVDDICNANDISNVDLIIEGQKILLP